jgi:hypothetical protein
MYAREAAMLIESPSPTRAAVRTMSGRTAITSSAGGGASGIIWKPRNA